MREMVEGDAKSKQRKAILLELTCGTSGVVLKLLHVGFHLRNLRPIKARAMRHVITNP